MRNRYMREYDKELLERVCRPIAEYQGIDIGELMYSDCRDRGHSYGRHAARFILMRYYGMKANAYDDVKLLSKFSHSNMLRSVTIVDGWLERGSDILITPIIDYACDKLNITKSIQVCQKSATQEDANTLFSHTGIAESTSILEEAYQRLSRKLRRQEPPITVSVQTRQPWYSVLGVAVKYVGGIFR